MFRTCVILLMTSVAVWLTQPPAMAMPQRIDEPLKVTNDGLSLPDGFKASIFADHLGAGRHIAVRDDGVVYVALRSKDNAKGGGIVALQDSNRDGVADKIAYFGDLEGTGIGIHNNYLYFGTNSAIVRWRLADDKLAPSAPMETVISGFPLQFQHAAKPFTFDNDGHIYVTVGAPSNACQERTRTPGSPGLMPCPQLQLQAGIWQFDTHKIGQIHGRDGQRYATGVRNAMALDWHTSAEKLVIAPHGRDDLHRLFPKHYNTEDNARLPDESIYLVNKGDNMGWPYSYWDGARGMRMQAPEYGGDGKTPATDKSFVKPVASVPGHWAPNAMQVYTETLFPKIYKNGIFIAYHGSWNRAPLPQAGYKVVFFPLSEQGLPDGDWFVFADGFKGKTSIDSPAEAAYRPVGLAVAPDGALFIADSVKGRVWRVVYAP